MPSVLGAAVVAVLVCWVVVGANSSAEHAIATTMSSPPNGIRWLVSVDLVGGLDRRRRADRGDDPLLATLVGHP